MRIKVALIAAGLAVLGISVAGVIRELGTGRDETRSNRVPEVAGVIATGGKLPEFARAEARRPAPPLRFVDRDEKPRALADLRGKVVILNFIYARCTDVCPLHRELIDQSMTAFINTLLYPDHHGPGAASAAAPPATGSRSERKPSWPSGVFSQAALGAGFAALSIGGFLLHRRRRQRRQLAQRGPNPE